MLIDNLFEMSNTRFKTKQNVKFNTFFQIRKLFYSIKKKRQQKFQRFPNIYRGQSCQEYFHEFKTVFLKAHLCFKECIHLIIQQILYIFNKLADTIGSFMYAFNLIKCHIFEYLKKEFQFLHRNSCINLCILFFFLLDKHFIHFYYVKSRSTLFELCIYLGVFYCFGAFSLCMVLDQNKSMFNWYESRVLM